MSTPNQGKDGDTMSVGRQTSGEQGATPSRESQQETGGNGGAALTGNQVGPDVTGIPPSPGVPRTETVDAAMTHSTAGAQDTHTSQAGRKATGLGTAETGGNQDEGDLPPPTR